MRHPILHADTGVGVLVLDLLLRGSVLVKVIAFRRLAVCNLPISLQLAAARDGAVAKADQLAALLLQKDAAAADARQTLEAQVCN